MYPAVLAVMTLALFAAPPPESTKVFTSMDVKFPSEGDVTIQASIKQGSNPRLIFRSRTNGNVLLDAVVGTGGGWKEAVDPYQPDHVFEKLGFVVLHRPGLPDPMIVALAMAPGGSDCGYRAALFGEFAGRLKELTPSLPDHGYRGGELLSQRGPDHKWELTVISERYQTGDIHADGPSRFATFVYMWDAPTGQFVKTTQKVTRFGEPSETDPDLQTLFGDFAQC